ncbi:ATP-binding protein [Microbispora sp. NBRC 16548]|uniref:YifB family Mg chelatase-like AAA ATPase n=1 Tax=Microbispora sp. NBRC 16548 TaxID=3030994 RepID=UPI0024A2CEFE|nr:ATP-binding protein [Microbispora sp. NBRC 16548]GLX06716.1 hypothetical protein Misp03_36430 [Microbispora sp. NBRC 16548]
MGYALTRSVALIGGTAHVVAIEADAVPGDAGLHLVGLPELSVWPARARIRAAILNSGTAWPDARITVSVSPAIPLGHDAAADLALAMASLAAAGLIPAEQTAGWVFVGELALDGGIRPVRDALPMVQAAVRAGRSRVVVPAECAREAAQVPGAMVMPVTRLADVIDQLRHKALFRHDQEPGPAPSSSFALDLADVPGNQVARRALEICAAGGHHLFMLGDGPAIMLAERLPGVLPPLGPDMAREVAEIHSWAEGLDGRPATMPPFHAPHHSITAAAMLGGNGSGLVRPGAVSLAHHGVLYMGEAPEFSRQILDGLRRPLETGQVILAHAEHSLTLPARFMLVMSARQCPCTSAEPCRCPPLVRRRYLNRLAGLLERVEVRVRLQPTPWPSTPGEPTAVVAARVWEARERAAARLADTPWTTNSQVPALELRTVYRADPAAVEVLRSALDSGLLTSASFTRVLRVAWTLADLRGADRPSHDDAGEALQLWTLWTDGAVGPAH